jgi:hypothetical protein
MTHATLPNLHMFFFRGNNAYFEGLLEWITAPVLGSLQVWLFHQLTFPVPQLSEFLQTSQNLQNFTVHSFEITFQRDFGAFCAFSHEENRRPFQLLTWCKHFDWQIVAIAQIIRTLSPVLSIVENLKVIYLEHNLLPEWHNEVDRTQWRELLSLFINVKKLTLYVPNGLVMELPRSLCSEDGEDSMALFPNLQELQYSANGSDTRDALAPFINERQTAGHPVRLTCS